MGQKAMTKEDRLRKVPLFSTLDKRHLAEIVRIADVADVPAGKVMERMGAIGHQFVLILEGQATVEQNGKVINRLSENDFFGEIALIANRPRTATVTADTAMKVLVVERNYFAELLEATPGLWKEIAIALCSYIPSTD